MLLEAAPACHREAILVIFLDRTLEDVIDPLHVVVNNNAPETNTPIARRELLGAQPALSCPDHSGSVDANGKIPLA